MSITVDFYSEKAIVVRNTLEHHGPIMEQLGGTFNEKLRGGRGWIFSKFKMSQVRNIVDKLNSGQYGNEYEQKSSTSSSVATTVPQTDMVSKAEFLSVLSRLERLEALVSNLCHGNDGTVKQSSSPIITRMIKEDDNIEDFLDGDVQDEPPVERKRMVSIQRK
jgi:hypothetical protein